MSHGPRGMWWPFDHIAIMSERPAEIHVDEEKLLHRGDGPAVVFRDDWLVYAWKGKAVPERWILQPEAVPPRAVQRLRSELRKIRSLEDRQSGGETEGQSHPRLASPSTIAISTVSAGRYGRNY